MFYPALILGLISSLHCIAMCGPVALMLPLSRNNPEKKALQLMTYHLGRLTSYTSLGLLFGFFGRGLYLAGVQQKISIFAGVVMVLIVLLPKNTFARYRFSKPVYQLIGKGQALLASHLKKQSFPSLFAIGLLNGLLPCAMVYAALFGALATQNIASGAAYMALFGLGTVPLMSAVVYGQRLFTAPLRNKMQKIIPVALFAVGLLLILRGLSLDLSHFSPSAANLFVKAQPQCR